MPISLQSGNREFFGHSLRQFWRRSCRRQSDRHGAIHESIREGITDDSGHCLIPLPGIADYTIHVEAIGFQPAEARNGRLQIDDHRELDFKFVPASLSTMVEVNATDVGVQPANPTLGQVITSREVAELPLNGRDFVQLATLTPGVTQESNPNSFFNAGPSSEVPTRGTFSLSVGGSRAPADKARPVMPTPFMNDRVKFEVAKAKDSPGTAYDFVAFFDCLHDMGDPEGAALTCCNHSLPMAHG